MLRGQYAMGRLPGLETIDDAGGIQYFGALAPRQLHNRHSGGVREIFRSGIVAHVKPAPLQQSRHLTQGCLARDIDQRTSNALLQLHSKPRFGWITRSQYAAWILFRDRCRQFHEIFERPHLVRASRAGAKSNQRFARSGTVIFQNLQGAGLILGSCPELERVRPDRKAEIPEQVQISFDLMLRQFIIDCMRKQAVVTSIVLSFFRADRLRLAEPVSSAAEIGNEGRVIPIGVPPRNDSQIEAAGSQFVLCKIRGSSIVTKSRPIGR